MDLQTFIGSGFNHIGILEDMYELYRKNSPELDSSWHQLFSSLDRMTEESFQKKQSGAKPVPAGDARIYNLIQAYRTYGHLLAVINPLKTKKPEEPRELNLSHLGFIEAERSQQFPTFGLLPEPSATLDHIIQTLKSIYCNKIGVEYMECHSPDMERWLQEHIEPSLFRIELSIEQKKMILQHLNKSELFESFLHTKYPGQKRFSLEGGETLIPILAATIDKGSELNVEDFVIGMAHRGRLNVLVNILLKPYSAVFSEFNENYIPESFEGSGDVKYHKGFFSETMTSHGHKVTIELTPNPSHLEAVDPVVEGQVRAKQMVGDDLAGEKTLPILIPQEERSILSSITKLDLPLCLKIPVPQGIVQILLELLMRQCFMSMAKIRRGAYLQHYWLWKLGKDSIAMFLLI
jgi:2-oxoglutarate dehydrogenase E1 component